jgi:site-specific DNA-methyltransferase (adenine-specific)
VYGRGLGGYRQDGTEDGHNPNVGRWPANIVIDEEAGALIDEQSGPCKTGRLSPHHGNGALPRKDGWGFRQGTQVNREYGGDSGGASRFYYCAKASRSERNAGCEGLEAKQRDLSRNADQPSMNGGEGNPFNRGVVPVSNHHPTVKPVALMRWLVRLIAPPGGLVLDPFMGSGTTGVACMQEGREFIGVECEPEYIAIAEARISHSLALQTQLVV